MAIFNYLKKEMNVKIVYYGPGLSGKTTNIQCIFDSIRAESRGKLVSLATQTDRTLFFDFLPLEMGDVAGYKLRFHLYTVPGQVFYDATRKLVLKGVDGLVFVADSQKALKDANLESFRNLEKNLASYGRSLRELPHLIQANKQDLESVMTPQEVSELLNRQGAPVLPASAASGEGVLESLHLITKMVMRNLKDKVPAETMEASRPAPRPTSPAAAPGDLPPLPPIPPPVPRAKAEAPGALAPLPPLEPPGPPQPLEPAPEPLPPLKEGPLTDPRPSAPVSPPTWAPPSFAPGDLGATAGKPSFAPGDLGATAGKPSFASVAAPAGAGAMAGKPPFGHLEASEAQTPAVPPSPESWTVSAAPVRQEVIVQVPLPGRGNLEVRLGLVLEVKEARFLSSGEKPGSGTVSSTPPSLVHPLDPLAGPLHQVGRAHQAVDIFADDGPLVPESAGEEEEGKGKGLFGIFRKK